MPASRRSIGAESQGPHPSELGRHRGDGSRSADDGHQQQRGRSLDGGDLLVQPCRGKGSQHVAASQMARHAEPEGAQGCQQGKRPRLGNADMRKGSLDVRIGRGPHVEAHPGRAVRDNIVQKHLSAGGRQVEVDRGTRESRVLVRRIGRISIPVELDRHIETRRRGTSRPGKALEGEVLRMRRILDVGKDEVQGLARPDR